MRRQDHVDGERDQLGGEVGQAFLPILRPAVDDLDVLALQVAEIPEPLDERAREVVRAGGRWGRVGYKVADPRDPRRLRGLARKQPAPGQQA